MKNLKPTSNLKSKASCPKCNGQGWIWINKNTVKECECRQEMLMNNKVKFANIPEAFKDLRLDSFSTAFYQDKESIGKIVAVIKDYMDHLDDMKAEGIGIYMWSQTPGSGKTRLATSLANELIHKYEMNVKFITSLDIIDEIRATWDKDAEFNSESQLMRYLTTVEVLVIDDLGAETHKDWIDDKFYKIINTRYVNKLITIFTSNDNINNSDYDKRITNRIIERSYLLHFPEQSVREGIAQIRQNQIDNKLKNGGANSE